MPDELLPLINTLELRGRKSGGREAGQIAVETQVRWKRDGIEAPAIILRELGVELIEEGLRLLKAVHDSTIPSGGVDRVITWDR